MDMLWNAVSKDEREFEMQSNEGGWRRLAVSLRREEQRGAGGAVGAAETGNI